MRRDAVTPELRQAVLRRDGRCFLTRPEMGGLYHGHRCFDTFGVPHSPTDVSRLTLDHVHDEAMLGKRAPSDERHLVALCGYANCQGVSRVVRQAQREYLRVIYGATS